MVLGGGVAGMPPTEPVEPGGGAGLALSGPRRRGGASSITHAKSVVESAASAAPRKTKDDKNDGMMSYLRFPDVVEERDGEEGRATEGAAERDGEDMDGDEGREGALGVDERNVGWVGAARNAGADGVEDRKEGDDCEGLEKLGAERNAGAEAEGCERKYGCDGWEGCERKDGCEGAAAAIVGAER